jgi:hypothetical protein
LDKVDTISAYSTDEPYILSEQGVDYNVFSPRSAGIDFYGDTLFTTEKYLQQHPERVKAFLQATVKGWEYALKNPAEIIDLILAKYSTRHSREHLLFEARESQKLILPNIIEIGYMNPGRWQNIAKVYATQGKIPADFSLDGFLYEKNIQPDLTKLYTVLGVVLGGLTLAVLIAFRFFSLNNALRRQIIQRQEAEQEKEALIEKLQESVAQIKALQGIIPICMYCKEIRDDAGLWNQLEAYIESHSDAQFSHGICEKCVEKYYSKNTVD